MRLAFLKTLSPRHLRQAGRAHLSQLLLNELKRARARVSELERRYPSASTRELAQRLVDEKKGMAGMLGGLSGALGLMSLPADWVVMGWLQISLQVEIATLYRVNLKTENARGELWDLFGYSNGVSSLQRASPKVLTKVAARLLEKGGLRTLGRALPLVSSPASAYLNNRHIQRVGDQAVRFYAGMDKLEAKTRQSS